ncbi:MAG: efflux RND transporter periplasmic adaptor subunit [Chromatiales bacterium]|nr:efflux RND transporter periplasmic adaptor subunit [Chromatiales bacterium]
MAADGAKPPPTPVIVAEASIKAFADRIEALGTLRANESVALTASVTETISALYFDDGARVSKGQVLVEMTSAEEHAQLEEGKALVEEARRQYHRVKSLETTGAAAKSLLDERSRELETARARLAVIESRLADRLIRAPFDGVIGLRTISVGALVEPGDLIATLDDDSVMKLDVSVPSIYLASLRSGLMISASTDAYADRSFTGKVSGVDSRIDPVTRTVRVRALLPNRERLLKPGMLMQVTVSNNRRDALAIPEAALMPVSREQFVLVVVPNGDGHKAERRKISIGGRRPGEVEVLDGLKAGERVVTHGTISVRPGTAVTIKDVDDGSRSVADILQSAPKNAPAVP